MKYSLFFKLTSRRFYSVESPTMGRGHIQDTLRSWGEKRVMRRHRIEWVAFHDQSRRMGSRILQQVDGGRGDGSFFQWSWSSDSHCVEGEQTQDCPRGDASGVWRDSTWILPLSHSDRRNHSFRTRETGVQDWSLATSPPLGRDWIEWRLTSGRLTLERLTSDSPFSILLEVLTQSKHFFSADTGNIDTVGKKGCLHLRQDETCTREQETFRNFLQTRPSLVSTLDWDNEGKNEEENEGKNEGKKFDKHVHAEKMWKSWVSRSCIKNSFQPTGSENSFQKSLISRFSLPHTSSSSSVWKVSGEEPWVNVA